MVNFLYNALLMPALVLLAPYFGLKILLTGKYRSSMGPKLGMGDIRLPDGTPRIWVHAVSVGEVTAAAPIIDALRARLPDACLVLSTSTETGQEMARKIVPRASAHIYFPLDLPWVVKKLVNAVRPDVFAAMETEIWPNFIRACKQNGARYLILNGRISPRSFSKYMRTGFFWRKVLADVDEAGVISETDAQRITAMGVAPGKVRVVGNAKYDSLASRAADDSLREEIAAKLSIATGSRVFVAGSTHPGEESVILEVYRELAGKFPDLLLIIVPRHIERGEEVAALAVDAGFPDFLKMSEINRGRTRAGERVVIVDVIGELFKIYSLATVVYCGGSLVPRGGQNILEAGAWGKVVLFGPHMEDFPDEKNLLEAAGAGITVHSGVEIARVSSQFLTDPAMLREKGEAGRQAIMKNRGAAEKYIEIIMRNLEFKAKG